MKNTLRGRPRLNLGLQEILESVRLHRQVVAAARELRCSDAYIHARFKEVGLTLRKVLETRSVSQLPRISRTTQYRGGPNWPKRGFL